MASPNDIPDRATLEAWDDAYVWHPFTPHSVYRSEQPLTVIAGEGHYLIDADGNRYLDAVASIWCSALGHRRPEIDEAIRDQLNRIAHATFLGNATVPGIQLAKRLIELTPEPLARVFYSDNGSTASEIALKMAYQYMQQRPDPKPGKKRFMALGNAYNGDTIGAVSVGGVDLFHARFQPMLFEVVRAPSPYAFRCDRCHPAKTCQGGCIEDFESIFLAHADELVAVILEPGFQGAGGMITYPPGYLKRVRQLCDAHDVLLIFDEVAVGMGRSGELFACQKEGVTPDILCLAKQLTGGYLPVAATLTTEEIYEAFLGPPEQGRTFFHGHTFTANPLGCAAALAVLDVFENDEVLQKLPRTIKVMQRELARLEAHPHVGDIRHYGLAAGIELVADRTSRDGFPPGDRIGMRVCRAARDMGVFLRPLGDVIVVMPPLTITDDELALIVDAIAHGIDEACQSDVPGG